MSNDQLDRIEKLLRDIRQHQLDLMMRVMAVESTLKRHEDTATQRQLLLYEWCAPSSYKQSLEALHYEEINTPADLSNVLARFKS
ncbi:hypothetical protein FPY71_10110 [Aureimonas fodinaquatilis]|uniref:Uncharacterized protein n=1 Tax=Aureimonas fodinaquatilis TaxID=2565783 RepID=A0A5B0DZ54_9HYPH|nr:hypothetical protein [Aureimonas fodinaquatilis]KAA0970820.1 hypothetical protein FPY71_10110 [Aureimonas fodinaquatilis]